MKILIAYAGRVGVTAECAELLKKALDGRDVTLCDLKTEKPHIEEYDAVIVGSAVYYGRAEKCARRFVADHAEELKGKKLGFYICCAYADMFERYLNEAYTANLCRQAVECGYFGGELKPHKQKGFFAKLFAKSMRNDIINNGDSDDESMVRILPEINTSEISRFADKIKKS